VEAYRPGQPELESHHTLVVRLDQDHAEDVLEDPDVAELLALPMRCRRSKVTDDESALDGVEQELLMVPAE